MPASTNTRSVVRQQPLMIRHITREELLEAVFSVQSDPRLYNENQRDTRPLVREGARLTKP
jgi:hypothetical protein